MRNLLVTGALGHIGTGLVPALLARGGSGLARLTLLDRLPGGEYAAGLEPRDGVELTVLEEDVCSAPLAQRFDGVDAVVHLAAVTNAEASVDMAEEVERVNFEGARRVAEACAKTGSRLVFLSTTSVYGPQSDEVDEACGDDELAPQSPYADSKLQAERALESLGESAGLRYVICRFGTIFGPSPRMRFHTVVNKFVRQASRGEALTVWRSALDQQRPYLDLRDGVRAIEFILDRDLFDRRVYNVLTVNASVRDLVDVIRRHVPEVEIQFVDSPILNQLSYRVSRRRFEAAGFRFGGSLAEGVADTFAALDGGRAVLAEVAS